MIGAIATNPSISASLQIKDPFTTPVFPITTLFGVLMFPSTSQSHLWLKVVFGSNLVDREEVVATENFPKY